jgi:hypothetical protein
VHDYVNQVVAVITRLVAAIELLPVPSPAIKLALSVSFKQLISQCGAVFSLFSLFGLGLDRGEHEPTLLAIALYPGNSVLTTAAWVRAPPQR